MTDIYSILKKCISYAQAKKKIIILLGFSIGAAFGLKLIESFTGVALGLFFYGYPLPKSIEAKNIQCPVIIFHA